MLISLVVTIAQSQDTVRIMHYNLLNYGNYWGGCTSSNNNTDDKNEYLKTIVDYVQPDIITVNEIDDSYYLHEYLLNNVLNINGVTKYQLGDPPNNGNSPIMNEIYYDSEKFELLSNSAIPTTYRDIDIFRFNYPAKNAELNCVVAHLKAGNDWEDEVERANETNKLMNYLNNNNAEGNYIFSGDFNVYTASEQAFQNLLFHQNEDIRFYDPVNQIGSWNNNSYYAAVHTQSTHTSGNCFSGGGMDDRFDFILISDEVRDGTDKIKYVPGSYQGIGQDGQRFNQTIVYPSNNSVPSNVASALYDMSDHLPVVIDLVIGDNLGGSEIINEPYKITFQNPATDHINLAITTEPAQQLNILLTDLYERTVFSRQINSLKEAEIQIDVSSLQDGLYMLYVSGKNNNRVVKKVIVSN